MDDGIDVRACGWCGAPIRRRGNERPSAVARRRWCSVRHAQLARAWGTPQALAARVARLDELAAAGQPVERIAAELGVTISALERFARKEGRSKVARACKRILNAARRGSAVSSETAGKAGLDLFLEQERAARRERANARRRREELRRLREAARSGAFGRERVAG